MSKIVEGIDSSKFKIQKFTSEYYKGLENYSLFRNQNNRAYYKYVLLLEFKTVENLKNFQKQIDEMENIFKEVQNLHPKIIIFNGKSDILGSPSLLRKTAKFMKYLTNDGSLYIAKAWENANFISKKSKMYSKAKEPFIRFENSTFLMQFVNDYIYTSEIPVDGDSILMYGERAELLNVEN